MIDLTWTGWMLAGLAVVFLGIAKAGFGGGIGLLATPLMALSIGARNSVGILLPILCAIDLFALPHYWRTWDRRNVAMLLPGAVAGIGIGSLLLGKFNDRWIGLMIGLLAIAFVARHFWQSRSKAASGVFRPHWGHGTGFGLAAGLTSTIAHAAGPVATMYLLPQGFDRRRFVGTTVIFFALVNATKLGPYVGLDMIRIDTLKISAILLPFVPLGVFLGLWLNRSVNEKWFIRIVYIALLLAGYDLVQKNLAALLQ